MTPAPELHPVYHSMNKPLTIWGIERRLFFVALLVGWATFTMMNSLLGGLIMFVALAFFGRWATRHDPQILRIIIRAGQSKAIYDPAKRGTWCRATGGGTDRC